MTGTASRAPKKKRASKCMLCDETTDLHQHRVKPRSLGGTDDPDNLVALCQRHHDVAHSLDDQSNRSYLIKVGQQKAKAKGVMFGNWVNLAEARAKGAAAVKAKTAAFARRCRPMIELLRGAGMTFQEIADQFNALQVPTALNGSWQLRQSIGLAHRSV